MSSLENKNHRILHINNIVGSMKSVNQCVGRILHIINRDIPLINVRGVRWVSRLENENHKYDI